MRRLFSDMDNHRMTVARWATRVAIEGGLWHPEHVRVMAR
jgi:hypothetical protein